MRAIVTTRNQRVSSIAVTVGAIAVAVLTTVAPTYAATSSAPQRVSLRELPGTTTINGMNKYGDVAGAYSDSNNQLHAFVDTHDGVFKELPQFAASDTSDASAINDNGDVVGSINNEAVEWTSTGTIVQLDPGGQDHAGAMTIDDTGAIYGQMPVAVDDSSCGTSTSLYAAAKYSPGGGWTALDTPDISMCSDTEHTENWSEVIAGWPGGGVVGLQFHTDRVNNNGTWADLDTTTVHNYATGADVATSDYAYAWGINGNGDVAGQADLQSGADRSAVLWSGAATPIAGVGAATSDSEAEAVNDAKDVVGFSYVSYTPLVEHPFLWRNGTNYDLETLFPEVGNTSAAYAINDEGDIAINASGSSFVARVTTDQPLTISGTPTAGVVNTPYTWTFDTTGNPTSFAITSGALPPGLTLDATTGTISGTPTSQGKYGITVTASDGTTTATTTVTVEIDGPPVIANGARQVAALNQPYNFSFEVDATPDAVLQVTKGSLPPGLTLDKYLFNLTGTPTQLGTYHFTVTASNGFAPDSNVDVTLSVASPYTVTPSTGPAGTRVTVSGPALAGTSLIATYDTGTQQMKLCTGKANKSGTFSCSGRIPAAAGTKGDHQILATSNTGIVAGLSTYTLT